jgi:hypothetical protein
MWGFFFGESYMNNVKLNNRRAGTVKLPGGRRIKRGQSLIVPVSMLMHKSVRKLVSSGRMQVSSMAKSLEKQTDSVIHAARDKVDALIEHPALEEASDKILDAVEDAVEGAVDATIDAVSEAASEALESLGDMLGVGEESTDEEEPKPKRRGRRKKSDPK